MLLQLHIRNLALLDDIQLDFSTGFNVLTGETGAGKSIIVDSLKLALGEKNERNLLSGNANKGSVEALFSINENRALFTLLDEIAVDHDDGMILLSREINAAGRSVCRVNGSVVPANTVRMISQHLIDIYGQYDYSSLLKPSNHLLFLDSCAQDPRMAETKQNLGDLYSRIRRLKTEYKDLYLDPEERERQLDLLRYQYDEINSADISEGEDEKLEEERNRLIAAETISNELNATSFALNSGDRSASHGIETALKHLQSVEQYSADYKSISEQLMGISYELEDVIRSVNSAQYSVYYDEARINEIEDRINLILKLKRKYGRTIPDILRFRDNVASEIAVLEDSEERIQNINHHLNELYDLYYDQAAVLSDIRHKTAEYLKKMFEQGISELGMKECKFSVMFNSFPERERFYETVRADGLDDVEFLVSTNKGSELKSLAKVLSGGELSRAMLVLKTICRTGDNADTMIFDEIDAGIGGMTSWVIGKKLNEISEDHQVICVTHLAQVASFADSHFVVSKQTDEMRTETSVHLLSDDDIRYEIARMIGGEKEIDMEYADSVIEQAKAVKDR